MEKVTLNVKINLWKFIHIVAWISCKQRRSTLVVVLVFDPRRNLIDYLINKLVINCFWHHSQRRARVKYHFIGLLKLISSIAKPHACNTSCQPIKVRHHLKPSNLLTYPDIFLFITSQVNKINLTTRSTTTKIWRWTEIKTESTITHDVRMQQWIHKSWSDSHSFSALPCQSQNTWNLTRQTFISCS